MDPFRNPPVDTLAAARLHVQALTDCGLPREALLRAVLENYRDDALSRMDTGYQQEHPQPGQQTSQAQGMMSQSSLNTRLSVSTTSSKSSGRASVMSTATTMSSVSSQGGAAEGATQLHPPPAPPTKGSSRGSSKPQGAYWCTFCDVAFQRKFDWKRHEDEFHERYKRYPCPNCNRMFWGSNTFNQHHKNAHGCTTCPHADSVVQYTHRKRAWACGFCGGYQASRDRYFDHVARHYEDGCNKSHWNHSLVIYGLLHQPAIKDAWERLNAALYGHLPRNQHPKLQWDPNGTGHAQGFLEGESPGNLQDLLEFFDESRDDPESLARLAHDSAIIVPRHQLQAAAEPAPALLSRPTSASPKPKAPMKAASSTRHMSVPQPNPPPPPPYDESHVRLKKQRSIAPLPSTFAKPAPVFEQPRIPPQTQGLVSSTFAQPMAAAASASGAFYDLTVTHVRPHMQQQQQQHQHQHQQQESVVAPMGLFEDWSSMAATVVDDSLFAGWQHLGTQR